MKRGKIMFVKTVKLKQVIKALATILCIAAAIFAVVYAVNRLIKPKEIALGTDAEMCAFLRNLGWETSETFINRREVIIPEEWNEVYTKYNELQLAQGFDLEKFRGKAATIYSYTVLNYDAHPENMVANLLICDGRLIGGDVSCTELGGFMQGLARKEAEKPAQTQVG